MQNSVDPLFGGQAAGKALVLEEPLSFWGGVDISTGMIADPHHPQKGSSLADKVVFLPGTKGSTAGPGALLELIYAGNGPAAIVLTEEDSITVIAGLVAASSFGITMPVFRLEGKLEKVDSDRWIELSENELIVSD
ncbi:MAG: DUF126 domain-containing protein [Ekhidna sp.]|nr:DUF126 domain-containing protein [Ekhidna sp.]